jgi:UPF0716 family protein affecting phage T7 exclusion
VIGGVLVVLGALMLVLPGQGILTILAGLFVMRFPQKRRLLARALAGKRVQRSLNYVRRRLGKAPLKFPDHRDSGTSEATVPNTDGDPQRAADLRAAEEDR